MKKSSPRERPSNTWIRSSIWSLIDHKALIAHQGLLYQRERKQLVRRIKSHLKDDRQYRAAAVGVNIVGHLEGGELAEAWQCLKGWYATAEDRPPKPRHKTMVTQTTNREELYKRVPPLGPPILINIDPKEVEDECPGNVELQDVLSALVY